MLCDVSEPGGTHRVIIELEPTAETIRGSLDDGRAVPQHFHGWLELSALLDQVRPRLAAVERDVSPAE
jgi:hypothetical protein